MRAGRFRWFWQWVNDGASVFSLKFEINASMIDTPQNRQSGGP
jgi:hypothetical protein